jgi:hypothetical protein
MYVDEIPVFIACEACYKDIVLATSFPSKFGPCKIPHNDGDTWACDLALKSVTQTIQGYSKANYWEGFVTSASHRMELPRCLSYLMVPAGPRIWYQPKFPLPNFVICETCYLDSIAFHLGQQISKSVPTILCKKEKNGHAQWAIWA